MGMLAGALLRFETDVFQELVAAPLVVGLAVIPRRGDARGDPGRQSGRRARGTPAGDVEHAPAADAPDHGSLVRRIP